MIRLTDQDGNAIHIAPDNIIATYDGGGWTGVDIGREEVYSVTESPEEVVRKVLEYKLAMARHNAALYTNRKEAALENYAVIRNLAGL